MTFFLRTLLSGLLLTMSYGTLRAMIGLSDEQPSVGQTIRITVDSPVDSLRVIYRPNSSVAKTELLVSEVPTTIFEWTPRSPGLVQLIYTADETTSPETRNVSVRFQGLSASGLIVMLLAGGLLFGGAWFAFRTLFNEQDLAGPLEFDPEHFPDT